MPSPQIIVLPSGTELSLPHASRVSVVISTPATGGFGAGHALLVQVRALQADPLAPYLGPWSMAASVLTESTDVDNPGWRFELVRQTVGVSTDGTIALPPELDDAPGSVAVDLGGLGGRQNLVLSGPGLLAVLLNLYYGPS